MVNLDPQARQAYDLPDIRGVVVRRVEPGGPAGKAGLKPGDVIQGINGKPVRDLKTWESVLNTAAGKNIVLLVWRDGRTTFVPLKTE